MLRGVNLFLLLFAHYLRYLNEAATNKKDDMVVEITNDSSLVGIREVRRVASLENCLSVCQLCAGLVYYPDNTCVIFNKLDRIVFSSFGATCCFAVEDEGRMECTRCEGNQSDEGIVSISLDPAMHART
ncbi:unnamed protein product [Litomosoides sigmodontis]|uniref:Apple domain-containing protein n=1 Tax=Litomosoides sigmodontis TaxID=42156 RepID=A0A3P6U5D0_LITSI|nr:unnamed protein product [Litomosoides sigmodontis]